MSRLTLDDGEVEALLVLLDRIPDTERNALGAVPIIVLRNALSRLERPAVPDPLDQNAALVSTAYDAIGDLEIDDVHDRHTAALIHTARRTLLELHTRIAPAPIIFDVNLRVARLADPDHPNHPWALLAAGTQHGTCPLLLARYALEDEARHNAALIADDHDWNLTTGPE